MKTNKTVLVVVDGFGINKTGYGDATKKANMKFFESLKKQPLYTEIKASGKEVGLDNEKDPGNSEVGHNAIGSGQNIRQGLSLVNEQFKTGKIYESKTWKQLSDNAKQKGKKLNVIVLLSDGRLHSDLPHLFSVINECAKEKIKLSIHALVDGRDVPVHSAYSYIKQTNEEIKKCKADALISTVAGRGVAFMDRYESNINMLKNGYKLAVLGDFELTKDIEKSLNKEYEKEPTMTDENMRPFVLDKNGLIKNGDSVLLLNYRGDRAVEMCQMFDDGKYLSKEEYQKINNCLFAGILQYDTEKIIPKNYLCPPPKIENTLTEWLCKHKISQFTITETVKFGHMTYFFNGNNAKKFSDEFEEWKEIKSDTIVFNKKPKMQNEKITKETVKQIKIGKYDFIKLNLSSPDMVGHTGDFNAVVKTCKCIDKCLKKIVNACEKNKYSVVIIADHGNAEYMLYENGEPRTSHTNSLVPFVALTYGTQKKFTLNKGEFGLTNVASTVCNLIGIKPDTAFNKPIIK